MPEFLLFSDLHAHNFQYGAKQVETEYGVINSRLADTLTILKDIRRYAVDHSIPTVLFGGDLFHERGRIDSDVLEIVSQELDKFHTDGIHLWLLGGNHDYADKAGTVTSLDHLAAYPGITKLSPGWNTLPGFNVFAVPYTQDIRSSKVLDELKNIQKSEDTNILLGHLGIQGATVGGDYILVSNTDADFKDLNTKAFSASFFGHFHKHQKLGKNAWYIGATHQHNWGDSGDIRGFLHVVCTPAQCAVTKVEDVHSPRFVKVHTEKDLDNVRGNDFVRVINAPKLATKARSSNVLVEELEDSEDTSEELPKELFDPLAMVEEWVRLQGDDDPELKTLGVGLLKKVLEESL